jgi:hypothetical protein
MAERRRAAAVQGKGWGFRGERAGAGQRVVERENRTDTEISLTHGFRGRNPWHPNEGHSNQGHSPLRSRGCGGIEVGNTVTPPAERRQAAAVQGAGVSKNETPGTQRGSEGV